MIYRKTDWLDLSVSVSFGIFTANDITEAHVVLNYENALDTSAKQFENIEKAINRLSQHELSGMIAVWARYYLSDAYNQAALIRNSLKSYSYVHQPPLNGTKVAVYLYFVSQGETEAIRNGTSFKRPNYTHYYHNSLFNDGGSIENQTSETFQKYNDELNRLDCSLKRNCLRTWIYVQAVDINYKGMYTTRTDFFNRHGLTHDTHYIASTGIEGSSASPSVLFLMDAYAVKGLKSEQIKHLYAPTHLSPTHVYGVTFERGTAIDYGDRRHVLISGTASIDNKGHIMYDGNVLKQLVRTFENISALLIEAEATTEHIAQLTVYLRDMADYKNVNDYLENNYKKIPKIVVLAPVCRPGWLVEVECVAIKNIKTAYPQF